MDRAVRRFGKDARGATAIEYCLIIAIMGLAIIGGVTVIANASANEMTGVANNFVVPS